MQVHSQSGRNEPAAPLGDDWLTRDPESFGDAAEMETTGQGSPSRRPWRGIVEDVLLYGAGMTMGLLVVALAWLVLQLATPPTGLGGTAADVGGDVVAERVVRN